MHQPVPINTSFVVDAVTSKRDGSEQVAFTHLSSCLTDTAGINPSQIQLVIDDQDAVGVFELGVEYIVSFQRVGRA